MKKLILQILLILCFVFLVFLRHAQSQYPQTITAYYGSGQNIESIATYTYQDNEIESIITTDGFGDTVRERYYDKGRLITERLWKQIWNPLHKEWVWSPRTFTYNYSWSIVTVSEMISHSYEKAKFQMDGFERGRCLYFKMKNEVGDFTGSEEYKWTDDDCTRIEWTNHNHQLIQRTLTYSGYLNPLYNENKNLARGFEGSKHFISSNHISSYADQYIVVESENNYPTQVEKWKQGYLIRTIIYTY